MENISVEKESKERRKPNRITILPPILFFFFEIREKMTGIKRDSAIISEDKPNVFIMLGILRDMIMEMTPTKIVDENPDRFVKYFRLMAALFKTVS